jgi:hypothetical protein
LQPSCGLPLQLTQFGEHELIWQIPLTHDEFAKKLQHLLPQAPQLLKSLCRSTHAPEQSVSPLGHPHVPPLQTWPVPQAWPQLPQLPASVWRSTHPLEQSVRPGAHCAAHAPAEHTSLVAHRWPHVPQFCGLL